LWTVALDPSTLIALACGVLVVGITLSVYGATGISVLLVLSVGLLPVQTNAVGASAEIFDQEPTTVRIALMTTLILAGMALVGERYLSTLSRPVRRVMLALVAMGVLGVGVAVVAPYPDPAGVAVSVGHAAGQPIAYALVLGLFVSVLKLDPRARHTLLRVWSLAILAEGLVVLMQLKNGSAYDPLRHFTRPYGTMGSDFLAAFCLLGTFASLSLRAEATGIWGKRLGATAAGVGIVTMIVAIARASVIGFALAVAFFFVTSLSSAQPRRRLGIILVACLLGGGALLSLQGFWAARLNAPVTQSFDRPATWSSGLRMAEDHPLTGVGSTSEQLVSALESNPRYRETPYGLAGSIPHNSWIIALAGSGIPYGLLFLLATVQFGRMFRGASRSLPDRYLVAGVVGTSVTYLTNSMFNHPEVTLFMLLAAAMVSTSPHLGRSRPNPRLGAGP